MDRGIWIRQGQDVQGPFPRDQVLAWVIEGKVRSSAMLSLDGVNWRFAKDARDLLVPAAASRPSAPGRSGEAPKRKPHRVRIAKSREPARPARRSKYLIPLVVGGVAILALVLGILLGRGGHEDPRTGPTASRRTPQPSDSPRADPKPDDAGGQAPSLRSPPKARPLTTEEVVAKTSPSVALIKGHWGSGTGFLIRPNLVVTNHHVIADELMRHVRVLFPDAPAAQRGQYQPTLLYEDPERDLALVKVDVRLDPLRTVSDGTFQRGLNVLVIGNPGLGDGRVLRNAVCQGNLSSTLFEGGQHYYQLSIALNPGNSGGPVLDLQGCVLGVVVTKATQREGIAFCIPIPEVTAALNRAKRLTTSETAELEATHRLRAFAAGLEPVSAAYQAFMELYVKAMRAAMAMDVDVGIAVAEVHTRVTEAAKKISWRHVQELRDDWNRVVTDRHLSATARDALQDLWDNYAAMRKRVDNPHGTVSSFVSSYTDLSAKREEILDTLRAEGALPLR